MAVTAELKESEFLIDQDSDPIVIKQVRLVFDNATEYYLDPDEAFALAVQISKVIYDSGLLLPDEIDKEEV